MMLPFGQVREGVTVMPSLSCQCHSLICGMRQLNEAVLVIVASVSTRGTGRRNNPALTIDSESAHSSSYHERAGSVVALTNTCRSRSDLVAKLARYSRLVRGKPQRVAILVRPLTARKVSVIKRARGLHDAHNHP